MKLLKISLLLIIFLFVSCKSSNEDIITPPKVKGIFSISQVNGFGNMASPGSDIWHLRLWVTNDGSVAGQITSVIFKIWSGSTLICEINDGNYSNFYLKISADDRQLGVGGMGSVEYSNNDSGHLPQWATIPNIVEVISNITDENGYTHELRGTGEFYVVDQR